MAAHARGLAIDGAPPQTYAEYYRTSTAFNGDYSGVMGPYEIDVEQDGAADGEDLARTVFSASMQQLPTALLVLAVKEGQTRPTVQCYHRLGVFQRRMGMPECVWDDNAFAFSGDLYNNMITTVGIHPGIFEEVEDRPIRVAGDALLEEKLQGDETIERVGPYLVDQEGTELVQVRYTVYVPPPYVDLVMNKELSPREAYLRLSGAIAGDERQVACRPLLNWLKVALTTPGMGEQSPLLIDCPTAPVADETLHRHRWGMVQEDLPALMQVQGGQGMGEVARELGALVGLQREAETNRQRELDEKKRQKEQDKVKLPSERFGGQIHNVMRLVNVSSEEELPIVWHDLASESSKQHRSMIQKHLNATAEDIAESIQLVVTPALVKKVSTLEFRMTNRESLETGMHPFVFSQHTEAEIERAAEVAAIYDFVTGQNAGAALSKAQQLLATDIVSFPQLFSQARGMLKRSMVWFATFFGVDHPLVHQHVTFLTQLLSGEATYEILQVSDARMQRHVPTLFLRWFQLRLCHWMNTQWASPTTVPVPDFTSVFQKIAVGESWEPRLPLQYELALQRVSTVPEGRTLSAAREGEGQGTNRGGDAERGTRTGVGQGGGGNEGVGGNGAQNRIVQNPTYKENLFGRFASLPLRTRSVLQNAANPPPICPQCPAGQVRMCLAYHVKGMCNERCNRALDHCEHTDAQDAQLVQWCEAHYRA